MKKIFLMVVIGFLSTNTLADRCPASDSGCTADNAINNIADRIYNSAGNIITDDREVGRVQEFKDTLDYCLECGMDAIKSGINSFGGSQKGVR